MLHPTSSPGPFEEELKSSVELDLMPDTIKYYMRNKEIKEYYQSVRDLVEQM